MSVPAVVQSAIGDEQVAAQVSLGSEDQLFVTPTRTIIYRGEGLLSDEALEEYSHDADRIEVSEGRRKARIVLHDDIEGEQSFTVPPNRLDDALHPVLAGVLNAAGVTEPGETVKRTFRFSELTVIVTSRRLLKHIGAAVWDTDYEEYHYEDATGLDFEEGSVATQVVLEVDGRRERIKAPNERAPELRAELEEALLDFYDVASIAEFERATAPDPETADPEPADAVAADEDTSFGDGISPLDAVTDDSVTTDTTETTAEAAGSQPDAAVEEARKAAAEQAARDTEGAEPTAGRADSPAEGRADATGSAGAAPGDEEAGVDVVETDTDAVTNEELAERLDDLTGAVKRQNELLETHAQTIEQLIEELKRMD